jgi:hypothetical protein
MGLIERKINVKIPLIGTKHRISMSYLLPKIANGGAISVLEALEEFFRVVPDSGRPSRPLEPYYRQG